MEMFIFFISLKQYKKILRYRKSVFRRILSQADICDPYLSSCLIRLKNQLILLRNLHKLAVIKLLIESAFCHKLFMVSLLDDASVFHDKNLICIADGRKTVCNDKACSPLHHPVKCLLDQHFCSGINTGGCLVKDQHWRQTQHDTGDAEKLLLSLA